MHCNRFKITLNGIDFVSTFQEAYEIPEYACRDTLLLGDISLPDTKTGWRLGIVPA